MAFGRFLGRELIEVIEWPDDPRDTLSWRFPDEDRAIKHGAQLIVREGQVAQFVYLGSFGDTFGPGRHTLTTANIPVLTTLASWRHGFESPFKADVYYVVTRLFTGNRWGTAHPVMLRDEDFGVVRLRAFGTYDFRITNPRTFLREVAGSDHDFHLDELAGTMRSRVASLFGAAVASARIPVIDLASRQGELGDALVAAINAATSGRYGIEITSFVVESVSVPPEVEQALDAHASLTRIGNLNEYVKYQMARALTERPGSGPAAAAAEVGIGLGMARQMMDRALTGGEATPTVAPVEPVLPELLGVPEAAHVLGVGEADVVAVLESGELKGRKIGSTWRIPRAAFVSFLAQ